MFLPNSESSPEQNESTSVDTNILEAKQAASRSLMKKPQSWTGPIQNQAPSLIKNLFESNDTFATTLLVLAWDLFGPEVQEWDPDIFTIEIAAETGAHITPYNKDKLAAALLLLSRDDFFHNIEMFIRICNVLSGQPAIWDDFDPADAFEVAWGINEALFIHPPENPEDPFSAEIKGYIRFVTENEGFLRPVDVLQYGYIGVDKPDILFNFRSDPETYMAFWQAAHKDEEDFLADLRQRWSDLFRQLASLPLRNGKFDYATLQS